MFIDYETNSGNAQLQSPLYTANPGFYKCISFWYYMNGINTGTLSVLQSVDDQQEAVWSLTGDQANSWLFGQVPMSAEKDFTVSCIKCWGMGKGVTQVLVYIGMLKVYENYPNKQVSAFFQKCSI